MHPANEYAAPVARIRSVIERLMAEGSIVARADGSTRQVRTVSITAGEGEALARWVLRENATRTIEIGLAYGVSALHICRALAESGASEARHVVLDPFQASFADGGLQMIEDAGVESLVEFHAEMSQIALPRFVKENRRFDFAFLDGNHRFDSVFVDLFYLGRLLRKGGVILLDDYQLPGVRSAVTFFVTNLNWRVEEECSRDELHHWVAVRTPEAEDSRDFRYFVDF
jgi:predicted O-methyltransferase YrrM